MFDNFLVALKAADGDVHKSAIAWRDHLDYITKTEPFLENAVRHAYAATTANRISDEEAFCVRTGELGRYNLQCLIDPSCQDEQVMRLCGLTPQESKAATDELGIGMPTDEELFDDLERLTGYRPSGVEDLDKSIELLEKLLDEE
jgi:hypothetical protein